MFVADAIYEGVKVFAMVVAVLLALGIFGMWMRRWY